MLTARQNDNIKQEICRIFKDKGLKVTIEANIKIVNFLDVTFDLNSETFSPYMKPNNTPLYIKNIPLAVNGRLSRISANEDIFDRAVPPYQEAQEKSGFK